MNQSQLDLVRDTFSRATRIAPHLAATFYSELFAIDPSLRALFRRDMITLGKKLVDTLTFVVDNLHEPNVWTPTARALAQRHVAYGVEARHYDMVGAALLRTLKHELGASFTPEARAAWAAAYAALAIEMCDAAYPQVSSPVHGGGDREAIGGGTSDPLSAGQALAPPPSASRSPGRAT